MNAVLRVTLAAAPVLLVVACSHQSPRAESRDQTTSSPPATTQSQAQPITKFADTNKDGRITRDEAQTDPYLARDFDKYDTDKNGILDRDEFEKLGADARERAVVDTDADPVGDEGIRGISSHNSGSLNRTGH